MKNILNEKEKAHFGRVRAGKQSQWVVQVRIEQKQKAEKEQDNGNNVVREHFHFDLHVISHRIGKKRIFLAFQPTADVNFLIELKRNAQSQIS